VALKGARRAFRTVLFTDIVGSTELAAELGDKRWRRTVGAHHAVIRRELKRHHGVEIDTAGDGFFAIFENPSDALRCAAAAVGGVHGLGLRIRAAIHTGEVEPAGEKVGGIAVHIAARLLAMAGMEEVLVSSTVRDLVAGSSDEFVDRGVHELRGVPGEWHVYALVLPQLDQSIAVGAADEDEEGRAVALRRQRFVLGALVGVIGVLAFTLVFALLLANRPVQPPSGPDTVVAYAAGKPAIAGGWQIGRGPEALAASNGVLWAASTGAGTVTRIDLGSGAITSVGQGGGRPSAVFATGSRLWVADRYASTLAVLDGEGQLLDRVEEHAAAIAEAGGRIWLADDLHDRLIALDPATYDVTGTVELAAPAGPTDLVGAGGALWVAAPRSDAVYRVVPSGTDHERVDVGVPSIRALGANDADVWLVSPSADQVARLDAGTGRVDVRASVCDNPIAIAAVADGAWVACAGDRSLWQLDRAGAAIQKIALDGVPVDVAADHDQAWVALRGD